MEERYVTFEQAKSLKELGFPQIGNPTGYRYKEDGSLTQPVYTGEWCNLMCATLSLAKKWINEKFGVFIYVVPRAFDIETKKQRDYQYSIYYWDNMEDCEVNFDTEDDALSAAIDKAIKQIKFDKERGVFDK